MRTTARPWALRTMLICGLLVGMPGPLAAQDLTATLDRSTIFEGETVLLRIDLLNPVQDAAPDYSPLNQDFRVLDTGTNSSLEMTNGRRRLLVQHNVLLEPRRSGEIVVPSLTVGQQKTSPLTITVMERPDGSRAPDQDVYIEVEVQPENPYVHAQIRFTVRLFHAPPITEGSLTPDAWPEGVVVERIGEDQTYQTRIGDARYRVIERRYALFPERSGELRLPEVRFRGRVADPGSGRTSLFSRGRRVSVQSNPVSIEVRPQPADFGAANWIPAAGFEITEVWPDGEPRFVQGEPVTRTLVVKARGLLAAQLPEIRLPEIDALKVYPDQATTRTHADDGWAVAQREQKFALVPTRSGSLTLPEIRVPWWDTEADARREFVIPARQVQVLPGSAALDPPQAPSLTGSPELAGQSGESLARPGLLWPALALVFALLWLVTLVLWWRSRQPGVERQSSPPVTDPKWRRALKEACDGNDPRAAARAVTGLVAAESGQPVRTLAQAARWLNDDGLVRALHDLDRHLYRDPTEPWDAGALRQAADRLLLRRPDGRAGDAPQALPPLYPA